MNVLLIADQFDRAEIKVFADLMRRGHTIHCLCNPAAERRRFLAEAGATVADLVCRNRVDLRAVLTIRRALRARRYDLVHTLTARTLSTTLLASVGMSIPIVTYRGTVGNLARWSPASRLSFLNKKVSAIVCVSEAVRRYLLSLGVPAERAVTIYKGHELSWYQSPPVPRQSLGVAQSDFLIGCTANARPVKGVDLLVQAMNEVMAALPHAHLLLVGDIRDPKLDRLLKTHRFAARMHVTGYRSDAPALMGACDLFVMPSRAREGLAKAVIEAMAQGVPALVTDAGGLPELVEPGVSGWMVPAGDAGVLAREILAIHADPDARRRVGAAGRDRIGTVFNVERTVELTEQLWRRCVG